MVKMVSSLSPWVGDIPYTWSYKPIKRLLLSRDGGAWGNEVQDGEDGTICLRIADYDYDKGVFRDTPIDDLTKRKYTSLQVDKLKLEKGDILIEKSGGGEKTPVGRTVLFDKDYTALFANFMDRLRFDSNVVLPTYAEYWLRAWYGCKSSPFYINQTIGIQNINLTLMLSKECMYYPALLEQQAIVSFLDAKCAEIDALSADIQSEIDTLEAYKRSVITEAVTKGLDKSAPMKESGIEWAPRIPESWNVKKAKYNFKNHKYIPGAKSAEYDRLALTLNGVIHRSKDDADGLQPKDFLTYQLLRKGELVFKLIDLQNISTSRVGLAHDIGLVSPAYIILHATGDVLPEFAEKYFLMLWHREIFNALGDNGVRSNLNSTALLSIPICYPSVSEQKRIVDFLDSKCDEIDAIIAQKQEQLAVLADYKKSIIYEYVTGKKEVPVA